MMSGFAFILAIALIVAGAFTAIAFNNQLISDTKQELQSYAEIIANKFDASQDINSQAKSFADAVGKLRITIIASDGTVLGDSESDYHTMDNHLTRSEIIEANAAGVGSSVRSSATVGKKLVYSAVKTPDGYYIRAAKEVSGVFDNLLVVVPSMLLAMLFALILAVYITDRFLRGLTKPIIEMNDSLIGVKEGGKLLNPKDYQYEELEDMATKINAISSNLAAYIEDIQQEREKLNYILDNVSEGFLLLDKKQTVLLINNSACEYLKCSKSVVGEHILLATRNYDFSHCTEKAIKEKNKLHLDVDFNGKVIDTVFTSVSEVSGFSAALIITMSDVTENRNAVKIRREFFSNASHELKTPITSIKGSAELLCSDISIPEKQKHELLERIGIESERMSMLINDIIMISRMESGELAGECENVEISQEINDCLNELKTIAEQENLSIGIDCDPVTVYANKKDIRELVSNLLVNAFKYNKQDGRVDISLKILNSEAVFKVRNDGEPIPPISQRRVFERFYRVDSGRSKAAGGTGLGLAIVKHVVDSLNGTVTLESNAENGTTFTVRLPINVSK